jgi:hypothetical protein
MDANLQPPPAKQLCPRCGQVRPIDVFRRVYKDRDDVRHTECRPCRNRRERRVRLQKRRKQFSKGCTKLRQEQDPSRLEILGAGLIASCGGLTRMLQLAQVSYENPGRSGFRSQMLATTLHLILKADQLRKSERRDLPSQSDADLQMALEQRIERVLQARPEIAVKALR